VSRILCLVALVTTALLATAAPAPGVRLGELLAGMRQIEAGFHQRLLDEKGELLQETDGRVELAHPGRFRWETAPPFAQLVVSDGISVWQYDPDLAQVVIRPLDRRADQVPSLLLSGEVAAVEKLYTINTAGDDAGAERFELLPRDAGSPFARLAVQFRDGTLERLEITDGLGQVTEVGFRDVKPLPAVDAARFGFETPDGVDEIRDD
jgi:outer membrane lipoprotein carrier protein